MNMDESSKKGPSGAHSPPKSINPPIAKTAGTKYVPPALRSDSAGQSKETISDQKHKTVDPASKTSSNAANVAPQLAPGSNAPVTKKYNRYSKKRKGNADKHKPGPETKKSEKPTEQKSQAKLVGEAEVNGNKGSRSYKREQEKLVKATTRSKEEPTQKVVKEGDSRSVETQAEDVSRREAAKIEIKHANEAETKVPESQSKEAEGKQKANEYMIKGEVEEQAQRAETASEMQTTIDQKAKDEEKGPNAVKANQIKGKHPGSEAKDVIRANINGKAENGRVGQEDDGQWTVVVKHKKTPNKTPVKSNLSQRAFATTQDSPVSQSGNRSSPQRVGSWSTGAPVARVAPNKSNGIAPVKAGKKADHPQKPIEDSSVPTIERSEEATKTKEASISAKSASSVAPTDNKATTDPAINPQGHVTAVAVEEISKKTECKEESVADLKDQPGKQAEPEEEPPANISEVMLSNTKPKETCSSTPKELERGKATNNGLGATAALEKEKLEIDAQSKFQPTVSIEEVKHDGEEMPKHDEEREKGNAAINFTDKADQETQPKKEVPHDSAEIPEKLQEEKVATKVPVKADREVKSQENVHFKSLETFENLEQVNVAPDKAGRQKESKEVDLTKINNKLEEVAAALRSTHKLNQGTKPQEKASFETTAISKNMKAPRKIITSGLAERRPKKDTPRMRELREEAQKIHERMLQAKPFDIEAVRRCFSEEDVQAIRGLVYHMGTGIEA